MGGVRIVPAREPDVPVILRLIRGLGDYETLAHEVVATEDALHAALFGPRPAAEVLLAWGPLPPGVEAGTSDRQGSHGEAGPQAGADAIGFALFFHNFSTFLGRRGLYLEDLFVVPEWRGRGVGTQLLAALARIAVDRNCGRMEWAVLDWNRPAIGFYERSGARLLHDWRICRLTGDSLERLAARQA